MPNLFGLNIAGIVNDAISSAGGVLPGTLTKVTAGTRTPGDIAAGTNPTTVTHPMRGFVDQRTKQRVGGTLAATGGRFISILGASLPEGVEPDPGDGVWLDGETKTFRIVEIVERDPAAALYTVRVEV